MDISGAVTILVVIIILAVVVGYEHENLKKPTKHDLKNTLEQDSSASQQPEEQP